MREKEPDRAGRKSESETLIPMTGRNTAVAPEAAVRRL